MITNGSSKRLSGTFWLWIAALAGFCHPVGALSAEDEYDALQRQAAQYTVQIQRSPKQAGLYVKRGQIYFELHQFDKAIDDYDRALRLDDHQDEAYFGRGLARGRYGLIEEGIADLTVYLHRHPDSSRGYTKRGVRYLWLGDVPHARNDLEKAIALDPRNAEAHDDLGVVLARQGDMQRAIENFSATVRIDPSYQKGHHNLAMAYFIAGQDALALISVNNSLKLAPQARNSLLLKAQILKALGRTKEAQAIKEQAEFLPEGNWSERIPVQ